jgi:glycosyltransferase involved in cell wall biosynthesis
LSTNPAGQILRQKDNKVQKKILLASRCAWTLYNFRAGLMRTLIQRGYTVASGGAAGDGFEARLQALGVPFEALPVDMKGINPGADLRLIQAFYAWYRKEKPDIVHHFTIKPVIYGSIAARLAGVPCIVNTVTGLGFVFMEENIAWLRRLVEWQYRVALACAHFTFFQNPEDRALFLQRRLVTPQRVGVLPGSGVDCTFFTPDSSLSSPSASPPSFLMVARLLREKGVYEFVEAARLVKQHVPEACFQLLGRRDERNPTVVPQRQLEEWEAEGVVTWLGEVPDVRPFVRRADVVVLPSYREGTPRSLLEAAAMGKPIITTDAVGCREVVEDRINGLLVPVQDAPALAQAMLRMIEYPAMREWMGRAGRKKVEQEFDEQIVLEKIVHVYEQELPVQPAAAGV